MNQKTRLNLKDIIVDRKFQPRHKGHDDDHVKDLAEAYEGPDADQIPDLVAFRITGKDGYFLVSGFNRFVSLCKLGRKSAQFIVKAGTATDAILFAAGTNTDHGLKRTNKDKRRVVEMVHRANPKLSHREVARICGVHHELVSEVRSELKETEDVVLAETPPESANSPSKTGSATANESGLTKEDIYEREDGTPKVEGVYTPRFLKTGEGEKCLDLHGNPMPDRLGDIFADPDIRKRYAEAMELADMFHEFWKHFEKLSKSPDYPFLELVKIRILADRARETVIEIRDFLREAVPAIVCPDCHGAGKGCKGRCRLSGYIARGLYDLDPEYQKLRRK